MDSAKSHSGSCGRLMIRSDKDAASQSLVNQVARFRLDAVTILGHSAAGDSQRNGGIDSAVPKDEEMFRTLKLDVDARILQKPKDHPQGDPLAGGPGQQTPGCLGRKNELRALQEKARFNGDFMRFANSCRGEAVDKWRDAQDVLHPELGAWCMEGEMFDKELFVLV